MFIKADNQQIGTYLSKKIHSQYKSARQFCKAWLEEENIESNDKELQRKANKLSQIKKGSKAIQIDDLSIFSRLLGMTCEEILSAGKTFVPNDGRMTNYKFAFSKDKSVWEAYIKREDNLILNTDEYDKTAIDYALQFKNYKLLQYLTNEGYIWFVGDDEKEYFRTFSAGTKIQRKVYPKSDMEHILRENDELRRKMIVLAIEHRDFKMLTTLKAREIPTLYQMAYFSGCPQSCREYYDEDMLEVIAAADEKTLDYFTEEFEITGRRDEVYTFMFPFVSELVDLLIRNKSKYVGSVLNRCIAHNEKALAQLEEMVNAEEKDIIANTYLPTDMYSEKYLQQERERARSLAVLWLQFHEVDRMLRFLKSNNKARITTNVICVSAVSENAGISEKIDKLNELYDKIKNYKEYVKNGNEEGIR